MAKPLIDHIKFCKQFLKDNNYKNIHFAGSFASYLVGFNYHPQYKPCEQAAYFCYPEQNNAVDPHAMGIYFQSQLFAYIPKHVAQNLRQQFSQSKNSQFVIVCFCTGRCSAKSAPCIYNVFEVLNLPITKDELSLV